MAVVVGQTLPFSSATLDLENANRWNTLFPLIRPSVKTIPTTKGLDILVDTALASSKFVHVVAFGKSGNLSSKLLDEKHVTAIVTQTSGAGILTAVDLPHALQSAGIDLAQGVVVVRAGKKRVLHNHSPDVIEVETDGELEADHILHLLGSAAEGIRMNPHNVNELLKNFVKNVKTTSSKFHHEKKDGNPAVMHAEGVAGYEMAKHAVERDLKFVLKNLEVSKEGEVVHSVHFSDLNGLSRLENYIIAGEIAQFLDSQNIKYALSHSTILNHNSAARGFSISICPLPSHFLSADPKPKPHTPIGATTTSSTQSAPQPLSSPQSKISFNDAQVRKRIEAGCNAVIKAEPTITEYDTIVGDGDCGYTLRDGAKQVLTFISDKDLSQLPSAVASLVSELEVNMGGTSGALYCIFLTALAASLATEESVPKALNAALEVLCRYTKARVGDRTMMDALIPFVESLGRDGDVRAAVERAREGVEGTKRMEARLGRSTYLDESAIRGVPDPGAYGLLVLLEGMSGV